MLRENYSPFEIALTLKGLKDSNNDYTDKEIGEYIGKSRNLVTEYLSLLKLPNVIMERELAHSKVSFSRLKRLAVGANDSNKDKKIAEYEEIIANHSKNNTENSSSKVSDDSTLSQIKTYKAIFTKKFIAISKKIDTTIKGIEKFTIKEDTSVEEKQAIIEKLDEIIAKAQERKANITSGT